MPHRKWRGVVDSQLRRGFHRSVATLLRGRRRIDTVFELLGTDENDLTSALGWTLRESPTLTHRLLRLVAPSAGAAKVASIHLQNYSANRGITDVELHAGSQRVIFEAKRGWALPTKRQLAQYARRNPQPTVLVVLSECSPAYAQPRLGRMAVAGVPVRYMSWRELEAHSRKAIANMGLGERRAVKHFISYLGVAMPAQDQTSNEVFVVAIANGKPFASKLTWLEIVEKRNSYFHPIGIGWPSEPPNYIGFRHGGLLRYVRHVDAVKEGTDPHEYVPEMKSRNWKVPHYFYKLGPKIVPSGKVRTGKLYGPGHAWAALDLLLTSKTVASAVKKTKIRSKRAEP